MNKEFQKDMCNSILNFVHISTIEMNMRNVDLVDLRIAFPEYLIPFFIEGAYNLIGPIQNVDTLMGIKVHPTWENAITLYCKTYPSIINDLPVFKMSLHTEYQEYELQRHVITDLAKTFNYKL